jgi:hypothetical protein
MTRCAGHLGLSLCLAVCCLRASAQQTLSPIPLPNAPSPASTGSISGLITDTDKAVIPGASVTLEEFPSKVVVSNTITDSNGEFHFPAVPAGSYIARIQAHGFSSWKVEDILVLAADNTTLAPVELGVEALDSFVNAITVEDLAEQQITAEEHQRILGVLPNFFVSYERNPQPLTRKQKFKLAFVISRDPLTFLTTGITAGIEQAEGDFAGYGPGFTGYASRYAATYGDRLSATFLGSAILPSLLHQDPRYFYNGKGSVIHRALYAIATTVICKGDNGHWQPNYSNVFGNLGAAGISTLYYPRSDQHSVQVTVDNTLLGIAEGSIGTLFQEFVLKHFTHGVPQQP